MRKIMITCITLAFILALCACGGQGELPSITPEDSEYDPFAIGGGSETPVLGYKFGLIDLPENCTYSGKPIEFDMYYQNGSFEAETGFLIFVDGIPQTYCINNQSEPSVMHKFDLTAGERRVVHISFEPNTGKNGDVMNLQFASILEPSFIADQNESYGNTHRLLELAPSVLTFEADSSGQGFSGYSNENSELIDNDIAERYSLTSASAADTHTLSLYDNFADPDIFSKENGSVLLTLEDLGGQGAQYRTTIFVDNEPVKIESSYDYAEYYLKEGSYISQKITIPVDNTAEKHSVYAISVPIDANSSGTICVSDSSTIFPIDTAEISQEESAEQLPQPTGNSDVSAGGNVSDISQHFDGTVSFCEAAGDHIYTVENYNTIVKYSADFQKIKSAELDENLIFLEARALGGGLAVFSEPQDGNGMLCTIYDSDLNASQIDVYSLTGIDPEEGYISTDEIDISADGKSLIYTAYNESGESCIYVIAIDSAENTLLYADSELGFVTVRFTSDGNIAYTADSYAEGSRREYIGIISSSGEKLVQQEYDNSEYSGSAGNAVLFDERSVKDGEHSSGRIFLLSGSESREVVLSSLDESQHAYLSPSGNDIITYCVEQARCRFAVYNNGKITAEWSIEYPESTNAYVSGISFIGFDRMLVILSVGMQQNIYEYEF